MHLIDCYNSDGLQFAATAITDVANNDNSPWVFDVTSPIVTYLKVQPIQSLAFCGAVEWGFEANLSDGTNALSYNSYDGTAMVITMDFPNRINTVGPEQVVNLVVKMRYLTYSSTWRQETLQYTEIRCNYAFQAT